MDIRRSSSERSAALLAAAATCVFAAAPATAQEPEAPGTVEALSSLSIEELARLEVRSASKQAEPLSRAPTSIFVITDEDVARSAATSIPEVLRLAPNLQVQQIDARQYAISARGFNGFESANKLLVLIDGRSVYTPLHSGVFWELHSPLLEDLEQIEVISGPGGTLYGPNAVNGVVNIVSKNARETLGGLVRATAGARERTIGARYGAPIGDGALRLYANAFDRKDMPPGPVLAASDAIQGWQAGFRGDFGGGAGNFTVQGDIFDNDVDLLAGDGNNGHNLLARWTRRLGPASSFQVQGYYDRFERQFTLVSDSLTTFDLEAQYNGRAGAHEIVVGGGVRTTRDEFINNLNIFKLDPVSRRLWVLNLFAQDRIALTPELDLIAGLKLEESSFTGLQFLPSARLAWHPSDSALLWAAVSRAVRTPSRIDRQLVALPLLAQATGFQSEKLIAFEAGYRGQPIAGTSLSVSLFYNLYDDLRTTELAPGGALPIRLANSLKGHSYGIEAWGSRQLTSWWRASIGLSALSKHFHLKDGAVDIANRSSLGLDPDFQVQARSRMDLTPRLHFDLGVRGLDDAGTTGLGGYVEADARLAWRASDLIELFVAGTGLLHDDHIESPERGRAQRIRRSVFAGTRLRF